MIETWTAVEDRGELFSTQIDSLASGSYSAVGTEIDNGTELARFGVAVLTIDFVSAPDADSPMHLYLIPKTDGTNYADGGGSVRPPPASYAGTFELRAVTTAQVVQTKRFELPPCDFKAVLYNGSGQPVPSSGNSCKLYTFNRNIA